MRAVFSDFETFPAVFGLSTDLSVSLSFSLSLDLVLDMSLDLVLDFSTDFSSVVLEPLLLKVMLTGLDGRSLFCLDDKGR